MQLKLVVLTFVALQDFAAAQNPLSRFIFGVAHVKFQNLTTAVDRCHGTLISRNSVLTTASCVTPLLPEYEIAVRNNVPGHCKFAF
jgi:hypothetical protein